MIGFAKGSRFIFDLGMNNGDDTAFYLSRGYNVVALDANPALCEQAERRFHAAIDDGRLTVRNIAISDKSGEATFHINLDNDHWSSLEAQWALRGATRSKAITVRCVTLSELFDEFGVPYYLKIDVEGVDDRVLMQLCGSSVRPLYVSVEDCRFGYQYMEILASCGYDGFKLLDQSTVPQLTDAATGHTFLPGSSGPFGNEFPGKWLPYVDMLKFYSETVRDREGNRIAPRTHWWDIHCTATTAS
jgi:FkbM family methyltransferase